MPRLPLAWCVAPLALLASACGDAGEGMEGRSPALVAPELSGKADAESPPGRQAAPSTPVLPEFYGTFVRAGSALVAAKGTTFEEATPAPPGATLLIHDKRLALDPRFIATVSIQQFLRVRYHIDGPAPFAPLADHATAVVHRLDSWAPSNGTVAFDVRPVVGRGEMVELVPNGPLAPGLYVVHPMSIAILVAGPRPEFDLYVRGRIERDLRPTSELDALIADARARLDTLLASDDADAAEADVAALRAYRPDDPSIRAAAASIEHTRDLRAAQRAEAQGSLREAIDRYMAALRRTPNDATASAGVERVRAKGRTHPAMFSSCVRLPDPGGTALNLPTPSSLVVVKPEGVSRWDIPNARHIAFARFDPMPAQNHFMAVSPSGALVAVRSALNAVTLYRTSDGSTLGSFDSGGMMSMAFAADDKSLAVGDGDGDVSVVQVPWSPPTARLSGHDGWPPALAWYGTAIFSGGSDGRVNFWNPATNSSELMLDRSPGSITQIVVSPNGQTLAALKIGRSSCELHLWSLPERKVKGVHRIPDRGCSAIQFTPDGSVVVMATVDMYRPTGTLTVVSTDGAREIASSACPPSVRSIAFGANGSRMFLLCDEGVDVWSQAGESDEVAQAAKKDLLAALGALTTNGMVLSGKRASPRTASQLERFTVQFTSADERNVRGELRIPHRGVHVEILGTVNGASLEFREVRFLSPQPAGGGWMLGDIYRVGMRNNGQALVGFSNSEGGESRSPVTIALVKPPPLKPGVVSIGKEVLHNDGWNALRVRLESIEVLADHRVRVRTRWTNLSTDGAKFTISASGRTVITESDGTIHKPMAWGDGSSKRELGQQLSLPPDGTIDVWVVFPPLRDPSEPFEYRDGVARFFDLRLAR